MAAALRYERVAGPEGSQVVDQVSVYNPEQIDDTAAIIGRHGTIDSAFVDPVSLREIFYDPRLSTKQQKFCIGTVLGVSCLTLLILISLFAGFGKVLFDITASEARSRHGVQMVPNLRIRQLNVMFYNQKNKTANIEEYANEIDKYLKEYREAQKYMRTYTRKCVPSEQSDDKQWCSFDIDKEFGTACTKQNNYGFDDGKPCLLFLLEDRVHWYPKMASPRNHLPFLCRMQYQFSSNVYTNISYHPSLPTNERYGAFYLNQLPARTMKDINGKEVVQKDGDVMYSLPPLLMVQLSFAKELGPFTIDCRIRDRVMAYAFDNLSSLKGQSGVSFDFMPVVS